VWDGAVKGLAVAVITMALIAEPYDCTGCAVAPELYLFVGGIGAGIGLGIDALVGPKTVYRSPSQKRGVRLAPFVGKDRLGLQAVIRF
jgi:hypothetical protein